MSEEISNLGLIYCFNLNGGTFSIVLYWRVRPKWGSFSVRLKIHESTNFYQAFNSVKVLGNPSCP